MSDIAYLIGGRSDGLSVEPAVFRVKVNYPDKTWEIYEHLDLGGGYPIVLRALSYEIDIDAAKALIRQRSLGLPD